MGEIGLGSVVKLSRTAWQRVIWRTFAWIGLSSLASLAVTQLVMLVLSQGIDFAGGVTATLMPIVLGGPLLFYHTLRSEQLRAVVNRLEVLASTDGLTTCLNRRAFTGHVSGYLNSGEVPRGALLVVDADHFKQINDAHGHDRGDEVLQHIASAIKSSIRDTDCVGRLGGEEFGVFLHGANLEQAHRVAERIRISVNAVLPADLAKDQQVTVSIGGTVFDRSASFRELFRAADHKLYEAKRSGRNQVLLEPLSAPAPLIA